MLWQSAWNIFVETAACDMHHAVNIKRPNERQTGARIETCRRQQFLANGLAEFLYILIAFEALALKDNFAYERVSV